MHVGYGLTERGQLKVYNRIVRSCLFLSEPQRLTLLFVLDRTIGWRKALETISFKEFSEGVYRRKAGQRRVVAIGTGLSLDAIRQSIHTLQEIGAIKVHKMMPNNLYEINDDWCHPDLNHEGAWTPWAVNESNYHYDDGVGEDD